MFIVLFVCVVIYWICEAVTEAMVWANVSAGSEIIAGDYHFFRLCESGAILGIAVCGCLIQSPGFWHLAGIVGMWLVGWTVYEAVYSERAGSGVWNKPHPWELNMFGKQIKIRFYRWMYITAFITGLLIFAVAFPFCVG